MIGIGGSYLVLIAAVVALLSAGANNSQWPTTTLRTWRATAPPGVLHASARGDVSLNLDDEAKKKIALEVLESTAATLREQHKRNKTNEQKAGCLSLAQAGDLIDAAAVLAVDSTKKEALSKERNSIEAESKADCAAPSPASRPAISPDANLPMVVLPGGCSEGMIAALFTLPEADRRAYVQNAKINIDLDAFSPTDRILLDITPATPGGANGLPYRTIQAACPEGPGGVKGMKVDDIILSSYLMTDRQWSALLKQIPSWEPHGVDFPQSPKRPNGFDFSTPILPFRKTYNYPN